jgi:hypothetical protein
MLFRNIVIFLTIISLFSLCLQGCISSGQSQTPENIPTISKSAPITSNPSPSLPSKPSPSITLNETLPTSTNLNPPNTGYNSPGKISPVDGAKDISLTPVLTWGIISPVETGFDFKLATDPKFDHILDSQTNIVGPVYQITVVLKPNTTYYWEVRARNATAVGDWIIRAFTTTPAPSTTSSNTISPAIFGFFRAIWNSDYIYLWGTTNLQDGTFLDIEIDKDGKPFGWDLRSVSWVISGVWTKGIEVGKNLPDFGSGYSIKISQKYTPYITEALNFPFPEPINIRNTDLKGSKWQLKSLNGKGIIDGTKIDAIFDTNNIGSVSGNSTINPYKAFYISYDQNNLITYKMNGSSAISSSDKIIQQEVDYLRCLRKAYSYRFVDNGLEVYDAQKTKILVFEKVP